MKVRRSRGWGAVGLAVVGLLACLPATAEAHPQLAGSWVSPMPPGGFMVYHFCVGEHLGNGVWRGKFTLNVSNSSLLSGEYELRMFNDHQGTLGPLSTATSINPTVGNVDLTTQLFELQGTTYRHRLEPAAPIYPPSPVPGP